jgi:phage terminase large subunit GpA-like protein
MNAVAPAADAIEQAPASTAIRELLLSVRAGLAPPPKLTVSEFADTELVVTTGPLSGTHWQTSFAPYQRSIMDAFHEPGVEIVVVMGSSQWGKTACLVNIVAYHIAHDPCQILVVEPTEKPMAEDFSRNRLQTVIEASPILADAIGRGAKRRGRTATNTLLQKTFRGGAISIAGANSAASLAARPTRFLGLDEIDRFPAELPGEGNTISVALKRTTSYGRRRRVWMSSSPTLVDAPIHSWWQRGDKRCFHVPCPACGTMHKYEWKNVRWAGDDPSTARIHCPACHHGLDDAERVAVLEFGEWRRENHSRKDPSIVSFHVWEAYSPVSSLAKVVSGFLYAREKQKAGDNSEMHTWQNTTLGEPIELEGGEGVDPSPLLLRREDYGDCDVPARACMLTMGVDTQDDRLEYLVMGWGPGEESWLVARDSLPGDPVGPEPWEMLDEVLAHEYLHESGARLPISATFIDSGGHRADQVYDYCHRRAAQRVYCSKGMDGNRPIIRTPSMPNKRARGGRKCPLYIIGVDAAKALLMSRLKLGTAENDDAYEPGPGYIHFPNADWADEELFAQLTAEKLKTTWSKGRPVTRWVKTRARNEMLDCAVLTIAALRRLHPDLDLLAKKFAGSGGNKKRPTNQRVNPVTGRTAGNYWRRRG